MAKKIGAAMANQIGCVQHGCPARRPCTERCELLVVRFSGNVETAKVADAALTYINATRARDCVQPPLQFGPVEWTSPTPTATVWTPEDLIREAMRLGWQPRDVIKAKGGAM